MTTFLTLCEAQDRLLEAAAPPRATEIISLFESVGRILAEELIATRALPPYDNSAMDGYAVKLADAGKTGALPNGFWRAINRSAAWSWARRSRL